MIARLHDYLFWGGLGLLALGIVIAFEVLPLPITRPFPLGVILSGIGLAMAFANSLFRGEISFRERGFPPEVRHELAARLWSALMLLVGAALAVGGMIEYASPGALGRWAGSSSGIGIIQAFAGTVVTTYGLVRVLRSIREGDTWSQRLEAAAGMGFYSLVTLLGLILLAAGLVQLVLPGLAEAVLQAVREAVPPIPTPPIP